MVAWYIHSHKPHIPGVPANSFLSITFLFIFLNKIQNMLYKVDLKLFNTFYNILTLLVYIFAYSYSTELSESENMQIISFRLLVTKNAKFCFLI